MISRLLGLTSRETGSLHLTENSVFSFVLIKSCRYNQCRGKFGAQGKACRGSPPSPHAQICGAYAFPTLAWECTQQQEPRSPHPCAPQISRSWLHSVPCPGWAAPIGTPLFRHLGQSPRLPQLCYSTGCNSMHSC